MIGAFRLFGIVVAILMPSGHITQQYDVVVYGGTSAAVIAAVQTARMGKSVVLVSPEMHLGGLSSSGLGFTDTGNINVIGGLSLDFYRRIFTYYDTDAVWKWQMRDEYENRSHGTRAVDIARRAMWTFEPHVAEQIFDGYVKEYGIPVERNEWLDRSNGVDKAGSHLRAITMLSGKTYAAKIFIDSTYEGDLMAAAGVTYHVGRESRELYQEELNGVQATALKAMDNFGAHGILVSPYRVEADPRSGVLSHISTELPGAPGSGDRRVQAYCYRMCLTDQADNRRLFPKPDRYDPSDYELLLRIFRAGSRGVLANSKLLPNRKTDTNTIGPFSFDDVGRNWDYPEASYTRRREILKEHETYQKGLLYFAANDPRVPAEIRGELRQWGLAKDEFIDNGGWPYQIYIREARRMIGRFVMTENELQKRTPITDPVGMGSYAIDSHNVQRYITPDGHVENEGDVRNAIIGGPYQIAYRSLVPNQNEADNLLVPVAVSSSHVAYGSIRMEPVFMILAQSAATAGVIALNEHCSVQAVAYGKLRTRLVADGQVLEYHEQR